MANTKDDNLPGALNTIADFLTWAQGDTSGLATAVSEYMGKQGAPGVMEVRQRAHEAGLDGVLQNWREVFPKEPAKECDIRRLIPESKIHEFMETTGLSENAVLKALTAVVPGIVYRNARWKDQV